MSLINDIVTKIRTATYAKDVRDAIAQGIEETNTIAEAKNLSLMINLPESSSLININLIDLKTSRSGMFDLTSTGEVCVKQDGMYLVSAVLNKNGVINASITGTQETISKTYDEKSTWMYVEPTLVELKTNDTVGISVLNPTSAMPAVVYSAKLSIQKVG